MRTRYIGRGAKIGCATASPGSSALPTTTAPSKTERKNVGVFIAQNCNAAAADVEAEARTLGKPAEKTRNFAGGSHQSRVALHPRDRRAAAVKAAPLILYQ